MRYVIEHEVRLHFAEPIFEHQCEVRLLPPTTPSQRVVTATLTTEPEAHAFTYMDYFGNHVHHFDLADAHEDLITRTRVEVETLLSNPFDYPTVAPEREREWIAEALRAQPRLWDFVLHRSALTPEAEVLAEAGLEVPAAPAEGPVIQGVIAVRDWIADTFKYVRDRDKPQTLSELIAAREGSAQDLSHLLIAIVRSWGVPARYVSGYQDCSDDEAEDDDAEPRPHAWIDVLIPGAGWRGIDATARLVTGETYVCVAVGRDARDTVAQRCAFKGDGTSDAPSIAVRLQRQQ
jgi:transglutaminase-like putative cysteine protease